MQFDIGTVFRPSNTPPLRSTEIEDEDDDENEDEAPNEIYPLSTGRALPNNIA
jgi:hypothetical protein